MTLLDWFRPRPREYPRPIDPPPEAYRVPTMDLEPPEPKFRIDKCPGCGCEHFTAGGPVTQHESNGARARIKQESAVLSCLGCGERYFGTKDGLRKPHEAALPPAWAMADLQARLQKAQDAAGAERRRVQAEADKRPKPSRTEFRTPPKPE